MEFHKLKSWPKYFDQLKDGNKNFEYRKDDRNYQEGDFLILREWNPDTEEYSGNEICAVITFVFREEEAVGLSEGYCVLGLALVSKVEKEVVKDIDADSAKEHMTAMETDSEKTPLQEAPLKHVKEE